MCEAIIQLHGMPLFTQITELSRLPQTKEECTQAIRGLGWKRVPVDTPVFVDVWSDGQFSLAPYTDGIHREYHTDTNFLIDEALVRDWYHTVLYDQDAEMRVVQQDALCKTEPLEKEVLGLLSQREGADGLTEAELLIKDALKEMRDAAACIDQKEASKQYDVELLVVEVFAQPLTLSHTPWYPLASTALSVACAL